MKNTMKNFIKEHGLQDYIKPTSKWWYAYYEMVGANYTAGSGWGFHQYQFHQYPSLSRVKCDKVIISTK